MLASAQAHRRAGPPHHAQKQTFHSPECICAEMHARTYVPRSTQRRVCELSWLTGAQVCELSPAPACGSRLCHVNITHTHTPRCMWANACTRTDVGTRSCTHTDAREKTRRCLGRLTGRQTHLPPRTHTCTHTHTHPQAHSPPRKVILPVEWFPRLAANQSPVGICLIAAEEKEPSAVSDSCQLAGWVLSSASAAW